MTDASKKETVLVVGATSSLAQILCHVLAKNGFDLLLAGRDKDELSLLAGDIETRLGTSARIVVADFLAADFKTDAWIKHAGDFNHMVIAVGNMGHSDPTDITNLESTIRINYTLPAQLATAAALYLADQPPDHKPVITIISSVAGDRGRQSNYAYGAAKAALNAFASGLRNRFFKQGVHVMTVKPGFIDTPMTWGMSSPLIASREAVADSIVTAMLKRKDVVYVPFFWRYIMLIIIHIPEKIFKRLSL